MSKKVELVYNSPRMAHLMLSSDLAITGGGTTLYELAATGTPALAFYLADNQVKNVKGMAKAGTIVNLGWGSEFEEESFHQKVGELINNYILSTRMSEAGQELVDGRGCRHVAKEIERWHR